MKVTIGKIENTDRIEIGREITNTADGTEGVEVVITPTKEDD